MCGSAHSGFIIVSAKCKTTLHSEQFCSVFKEQITVIVRRCERQRRVIFASPDDAHDGARCEAVPYPIHTSLPAGRRKWGNEPTRHVLAWLS